MKLIDKLKNALFEEEYVEVEEKPKPVKKEKPIAKKIVIPEPKKEEKKETKTVEAMDVEQQAEESKKDFKFPAILEDDFIEEKVIQKPEKRAEVTPKKENRPLYPEKEQDKKMYTGASQKGQNSAYGMKEKPVNIKEYGAYEKKNDKKTFQPSPIISPIYGVLDQNYKKEEIVTKKEVRITSSYASKNIDVDSIREKAYGNDINGDAIFEEELTSSSPSVTIQEEDVLLDISDNAPTVDKVTMGDAEEYFKDLGLEYNIDYKDASHEKVTGRRSDLNQKTNVDQEESDDLEDNLFDLIDSMYEEKKGE